PIHDQHATGRHEEPGAPVIEEIEVPKSGPHEVQPEHGPDQAPVDIEPEGDSDGVPDHVDDGPSTQKHTDPHAPVITQPGVPPSGPHEAPGPESGPEHERVDIDPEADGVPHEIHDEPSTQDHSDGVPDRPASDADTEPQPAPVVDAPPEPAGPHDTAPHRIP